MRCALYEQRAIAEDLDNREWYNALSARISELEQQLEVSDARADELIYNIESHISNRLKLARRIQSEITSLAERLRDDDITEEERRALQSTLSNLNSKLNRLVQQSTK